MSGPETLFVPWIRPAILGDADIDDAWERQCESSRYGAVIRRREREDAAAWAARKCLCPACRNEHPPTTVDGKNGSS
jgi:hypothetical protein